MSLSLQVHSKRIIKRHLDTRLFDEAVETLLRGEPLPQKNKDHPLSGDWSGYRECHIEPDWLLIYRIYEKTLVLLLVRTGTHSDVGF